MIIDAFLRRELGRTLDVNVSDKAWAWVQANGGWGPLLASSAVRHISGREALLELIDVLREMLRAAGQLEPCTFHVLPDFKPESDSDEDYSRYTVLSWLAARDAAGDEELRQFRHKCFPKGPLDLSELKSWIARRYHDEARDDLPTVWLGSVPLPQPDAMQLLLQNEKYGPTPVDSVEVHERVFEHEFLERCSWHLLAYGTPLPADPPGYMEERKIPVMAGSTLDQLRQLSCRLAQQYGWSQAQSTTFIATGMAPLRLPINVWTEHNERLPGLSVIHLAIDPGMSPKEVGEAYLEERKRLLGTRYRDLSAKHLALGIFVATQSPQLSWAERMDRWNSRFGNRDNQRWAYSQVANFSHDCLQAQRRLLRSEAPIVGPTRDATHTPTPSRSQTRDNSEEERYVETWAQ